MEPILIAACATTSLAIQTTLSAVDCYSAIKDQQNRKTHITLLATGILAMLGSALMLGSAFTIASGGIVNLPLITAASLVLIVATLARLVIYKKNPSLNQYYSKLLDKPKATKS